jgi:peptidoglycan/LPS O-acetylase OafA/YrhL
LNSNISNLDNNPSTKSNSVIAYRPQLDGLRFIAVFCVLLYHYSDWLRAQLIPSLGAFISFFFVLSSYLITTILLTKKDSASGKLHVAYNFLVRRTLRIFPPYYLYLLILILLPFAGWDVRQHAGLYFSYLCNFHIYAGQYWDTLTSHLWTLAVEEQFYIVWIWVILFIPNRFLLKVFGGLVLFSIAFRLIYFFLHKGAATEIIPYIILTPACVDGFAFGAILAYLHLEGKTCSALLKKVFLLLLPVWFILIKLHAQAALLGFDHVFVGIGSMILIEGADKGYRNMFGRFLEHRWVTGLGKISYGIYLYHILVPFLFWKAYNSLSGYLLHVKKFDLAPLTGFLILPGISMCLYFLMTVGCASLSWYLLEQPISSLKRYFSYRSSPKKLAAVHS